MEAKDFGLFLKRLRNEKNMTIRQLELYSKVSNAYLSQLENGKRGIPSPEILDKLSKPLGVSYEELMEKAGYITKEEVFNTALRKGYFDNYKNVETDDVNMKEIIRLMFDDPEHLFSIVSKEAKEGFLNEIFSDKGSNDFWNEMIRIALTAKGFDLDRAQAIAKELETLTENEVDDVIDYIKYKKSKSKDK